MRWLVVLLVVMAGCMSPESDPDAQGTPPSGGDEDGGAGGVGQGGDPGHGAAGNGGGTGESDGNASAAPEENATPEPMPRDPVTWMIRISGNQFVDGSITVQQGDTVRWVQQDTAPHTVTADDGAFHSGDCPGPACLTLANDEFEHTFDTTGDFSYHCEVHPSMTGTITVLEVYLEGP